MSKRYTVPYSWREVYLPNKIRGPTDAATHERTTDTWTFREGIFLPGTHEEQDEYSKQQTLLDPKKYNVVARAQISRGDLLKFDVAPGLSSTPVVQKKVVDFLRRECRDDFQAFSIKIRTGLKRSKKGGYDPDSEAYTLLSAKIFTSSMLRTGPTF